MNKRIVYADLHTHTTASDGTSTPTQVVEKSKEIGLSVLAITDHDTLAGVKEAVAAGKKNGVKIVSGIEISCGWEERDSSIHVLGLFVDDEDESLITLLDEQKKSRFIRAHKILNLLMKEGIDIKKITEDFNNSTEKVLGRPHIARFLVENGHVKDFQQAFDKYLLRGRSAYVPKEKVDPAMGIERIQKSGGIAVLAHPGLIPDWDAVWGRIRNLPWDGIEVYYSEHSNKDIKKFLSIVNSNNMVATGGSDYHGEYGRHEGRLGIAGLSNEQFDELVVKHNMKERVN